MKTNNKYNSTYIENKIYNFWLKEKFFESIPNNKESYTLIMPPPNVTGKLHIGHILNNTIQDVIIRLFRMKGYNTCWVPGTDHASIATEAKINFKLKNNGISKYKLGRTLFLQEAWKWAKKHINVILKQLQMLGCSCDWKRNKFTMDKNLSDSVNYTFIKLYNKGWIYRDYRMIYWDSESRTTISDEEVIYKNITGKLYYIKYKIYKENNFITIATTRPETIFGDTAICIHPDDKRYNLYKGKYAIVPIVNRIIPIIEDKYVDINFGSGCLKITPAHDFNDKILADKHGLNYINIFLEDGTINKHGLHYQGKDRLQARNEIIKELKVLNFLEKEDNHYYKIALSERTNNILEPKLSLQWFLKTSQMAKYAINAVINNEIKFYPDKLKNNYFHWMNNIKDWNISRQLWWGHRIPVYYYDNNLENFIVAKNRKEAIKILQKKIHNINIDNIKQDPDVLDTWFSSWILPISIFNGIKYPKNKEILYYYPSKVLVSGPDILFFWIARMIMAGYTFMNKKPFDCIYFTGIIRDNKFKKMSKSLGNSPDIIQLINKYGADSIRSGILINTKSSNDLIFNEQLCIQGRNFSNKIWNAFNLIIQLLPDKNINTSNTNKIAISWIKNKFYKLLKIVNQYFDNYKISEALIAIYKFIWDDFCAYYLEIIKHDLNKKISLYVLDNTIFIFENILKILHPYMPFITEEIWQSLKKRKINEALIISEWPKELLYNNNYIKKFEYTKNIISIIRNIRITQNIPHKQKLVIYINENKNNKNIFFKSILLKIAYISKIIYIKNIIPKEKTISFLLNNNKYYIPIYNNIINNKNLQYLKNQLKYQNNYLLKIKNNINNNKFMKSAPKHIINLELKKENDVLKKINAIQEQIKNIIE